MGGINAMTNNEITNGWIAQQRAVCEAANASLYSEEAEAAKSEIVCTAFDAALDALEAAYAEIALQTAERDAAVNDMFGCMSTQGQCVRCKKRYYCDGTDDDKFSPLCKNRSHCYAWEWRGLHADNTNAPTGAESDPIKDVNMKGISIHNCGDVKSQKIISIKTMDDNIDL